MKKIDRVTLVALIILLSHMIYSLGCSKVTPTVEPELNPEYMNISIDSTTSSETIRVY